MAKQLGEVAEQLRVFGEGMKEHMKLIQSLQEVADAMREAVNMLGQGSDVQK